MKLIFFFLSWFGMNQDVPLRDRIAYQTMDEFYRQMHIYGLESRGGFGLKEDKSNQKLGVLKLHFTSDKALTMETGRALIVQCIDLFVDFLNSKKEIGPYMTTFPVTPRQVDIIISCKEEIDNDAYLSTVIGNAGKISYFSASPAQPNFGLVCQETYEEACGKLQKANTCSKN